MNPEIWRHVLDAIKDPAVLHNAPQPDGELKVRLWDSIPVRLGLGVLMLTLATVTLVLMALTRQEARQRIEQDSEHARQTATIVAADLASRMLAGGGAAVWTGVSAVAAQHAGVIDAARILLVTQAGLVKAGSDAAMLDRQIAMAATAECPGCGSVRAEDFPATAMLTTAQGAHTLRVVNPVPVSVSCLECHDSMEEARSYVFIDFDLTPMERASQRRQWAILGMGLAVTLALVALIAFLFRRLVMRPADLLIAAMGRLALGDLSARTPVLARNELGLLARDFNQMAGQIEDQVAHIEAAHTESTLLYTLVVEASKKLEMAEFATGVTRVIVDKLHARHAAFFLETASNSWICTTAGAQQQETVVGGEDALEAALLSGAAQVQQLLDGVTPQFALDACRTKTLQLTREAGELSLALPVVAQARLIGLLVCVGIASRIRMDEDLFNNLGAHLTLAAVNSRNYTGAITDGLTRLRNKQYGLSRLDEAVSAARRYKSTLALGMCDIDHFKRVNDKYGHPAGDAVLKEVSRRIAACLRTADTAVRYGGEEFMLILPEADANALAAMGERIRQSVAAAPVGLGAAAGVVPITISVGIATFHADADSGESLIARDDRMLYRAKRSGRNRVELEL